MCDEDDPAGRGTALEYQNTGDVKFTSIFWLGVIQEIGYVLKCGAHK